MHGSPECQKKVLQISPSESMALNWDAFER